MSMLPGSVAESNHRTLRLDEVRHLDTPGGWILQLSWTVLGGNGKQHAATGMQLYLDEALTNPVGDKVNADADGPGEWSQTAADYRLVPGLSYWIAVIDDHPGAKWSNAVPVLWQALRLESLTGETAATDGAGSGSGAGSGALAGCALDVAWQPPAPPLTGYEVGLTSAAGEPVFAAQLEPVGVPLPAPPSGFVGARVELSTLPLPLLAPRMPFWMRQISVAADGIGRALGPTQHAQAFVRAPQLLSVRFVRGDAINGLTYTIRLRIPGDETSAPTFAASVTANGRPYADLGLLSARPDETVAAEPAWAVDVTIPPIDALTPGGAPRVPAGTAFSMHLARADALSTGPSAAIPVPTHAPAVTGATYDGQELEVRLAQPDDAAALVTVSVLEASAVATVVTAIVEGPHGIVPLAAESGLGYIVSAAAVADGLLGPASAPVDLLTSAPTLTTLRYQDGIATATWAALETGVSSGYVLRLKAGTVVVAESVVGGTSASVSVPAGDLALDVEVAAIRGTERAVTGPACGAVPLLTAVPSGIAATTGPIDGVTTLTWSPVPGATGYEIQVFRDGAPDGSPVLVGESRWILPHLIEPEAVLTVTVAAVCDADHVTRTGPATSLFPLPTARSGAVAVSYDGVDATVSWHPVPGALGYEISILANGAVLTAASADAGAAQLTFPVQQTPAAAGYRAVVQVRTGTGIGPATDPVPLLAPALYFSTAPATTEQPHVFGAVYPGDAPADQTAALPDLGITDPAAVLPIQRGPFVLAASSDPGSPYPYQLTVLADSGAWSFPAGSVAIRSGVKADYNALLVAAEQAGVNGPALYTLMNAVARILPQTFAETLYYATGLDAAARTVDLRPGLVLRISPANYLTVPASTGWINGYTGGASFDVEVGGYLDQTGQWQDGFDPFIARLVAAGALDVPAPEVSGRNQSGIAAAADLFAAGLRRPYHRLFTPGALMSPTGPGSMAVASNFLLAAAPRYADLIALANPPAGASSGYFRGRAIITPCVRITVNGAPATVPLGTTVGGLLDAYTARPPGGRLSGLTLHRPDGPAVLAPIEPGPVSAAAHRMVRFDWGTLPTYGRGLDALALPLLPGDRLGFAA